MLLENQLMKFKHMKISILTVLSLMLWVSVPITSHGQTYEEFDAIPSIRTKAGYHGESLIHPGWNVGVEKTFKSWLKTKNTKRKKRPVKKKYRELFLEGTFNGYNIPNNEFNMGLNVGLGYRRTNDKGRFISPVLTVGGARYFNNIPTYELGNTEPERVRFAGRNAYTFSFGVELGKNMLIKKGLPYSWYIKPSLLANAPYNHSFNLTATVDVGVILYMPPFNFRKK